VQVRLDDEGLPRQGCAARPPTLAARSHPRAAAPSTTPAAPRADNFNSHAKKCSQGAAPLPDDN
jgi:hypothetical protein